MLGHSDRELDRLSSQSRPIDPITRRFFAEAGIGAGMRISDVGSGAGDVAFLAAEMVGGSGEVVGVDRSAAAIEVARGRAAERLLANVSFVQGDPAMMAFEEAFDAAIGRYVLQFQDDPAGMLRGLAAHVRPGGWSSSTSSTGTASSRFPRCRRTTVAPAWPGRQSAGVAPRRAWASSSTRRSWLSPSTRLEAVIGGGVDGAEPLRRMADLAGSLAVTMEQMGIAMVADLDSDTLFDLMQDEAKATASVVIGHLQVGA